ncbi:hypothetical protein [Shimia sagamensis]|uniref:Replication initiation factor n=1 Tax=Shimia sagamensis TaxID=1566352 RepID=A0ABY1PIE3_9RHOB|nr:hypothetical protein [Shimia sagamensis]SMP34286.1 hypothetical protein SAMN06265373_1101 [Shimia sagamensis]
MDGVILHSGFDGLKFTLTTDISPSFREELASAKAYAKETMGECLLEFGNITLSVTNKGARGFTAHTGDFGAVWLFQDLEDRIPNNPGITVDFRAFGLATGGLEGAERHFRECMAAFGIPYVETQLRVARADFAVDVLAPWFEPDREALVVPPGTKVTEYTGVAETATIASGSRVVGLSAGAIANRQLAIYDKRTEVMQTNKMGWLTIWNAALAVQGRPSMDLSDRATSQVWRFELRLGSKQLRNRFEMRSWQDVHDIIGDALTDALRRMRYCIPTTDSNRARWPALGLWRQIEDVVSSDLTRNRAGVLPCDVIQANRTAKTRELDAQLTGLFVTRAAISDVSADAFSDFMENHVDALIRQTQEHPVSIEDRLAKAGAKYQLR